MTYPSDLHPDEAGAEVIPAEAQVAIPAGKPEYAGFNIRVYASMIDSALSLVVFIPLGWVLYGILGDALPSAKIRALVEAQDGVGMQNYLATGGLGNYFMESLFQFLVFGLVIMVFWIARDATPGKQLFRLRIVDATTLQHPTPGQFTLRLFGYFLSVLPAFLGFFWMIVDGRKQCFHDKIANTVVIKVPRVVK